MTQPLGAHSRFKSNWELSVARAFSVIRCLTDARRGPVENLRPRIRPLPAARAQRLPGAPRGKPPYRNRFDEPEERKAVSAACATAKWFLIILAIVVIPVTMTCVKIIQYAQESKEQVYDLHRHIVNALSLNTNTYFQQLNMRLAFAPLLARTRMWGEQVAILNNALMSNSDFACVALVDSSGKEQAKAFDSKLRDFMPPLDLSTNKLFLKVSPDRHGGYRSGL